MNKYKNLKVECMNKTIILILSGLILISYLGCRRNLKTKTLGIIAIESLPKTEYNIVSDSINEWIGSIQGTENRDSSGVYIFGENEQCDIIWMHPSFYKMKRDSDINSFFKYLQNVDKDQLNCFAFEIAKIQKMHNRDLDRYDYVFPASVKIFIKKKGFVHYADSVTIRSFEDLGKLKLSTIYKYQ